MPQLVNQCQLYGWRLSLYSRRGAGPCHNSQSSVAGTAAGLPTPMGLRRLVYQVSAQYARPISPLWIFSTISIECGDERCCEPIWQSLPYFFCASTSIFPSRGLWEQGFSTYTCLPASSARMAMGACQ